MTADDLDTKMTKFRNDCYRAIQEGRDDVEADEDVIGMILPGGMGPKETYFNFGSGLPQSVRVYRKGKVQETKDRESLQIDQILHPEVKSFMEGLT